MGLAKRLILVGASEACREAGIGEIKDEWDRPIRIVQSGSSNIRLKAGGIRLGKVTPAVEDGVEQSKAEIRILPERCKGCGLCVAFCPTHVYRSGKGGVPEVVDPVACNLCGLCELRCPDFAIRVLKKADPTAPQGGISN